ncbi:MAG: MarR family transcriptional regulator [Bacteroidales bacterium]|nr:MarR family transcriptional regulator [Bacteroidales bacterium]
MKQKLAETFKGGGFSLSPEQFLVMDTLWDEGVLTQQQIADITMRDKNSIVKLIDGLESRELVRRSSNPDDRRQNLIEVTPYSLSVREKIDALAYESVHGILGDITKKALETFVKVLARMESNMDPASDLESLAEKYPTKQESNG